MKRTITRRTAVRLLAAAGVHSFLPLTMRSEPSPSMIKRLIPSSGEMLPVVGLGTWQQFDVGPSDDERKPLREVIAVLAERGGSVIDSSPMYGRSEEVVGDLTNLSGNAGRYFYATKVWTDGEREGIDQMTESMRKMRRETMDLMQIHNLVDWKTHLKTLRRWKSEGKIRYIGITHYTTSAHDELERIVRTEQVDFIQFNYSIRIRNAERSLLPAAQEKGTAVIINEPYEKGSLFSVVRGKELPDWVKEYDINSWGQFFLKFILSHPAVTCVIPGTSNPKHAVDNMGAGHGAMPNETTRKRMASLIDTL